MKIKPSLLTGIVKIPPSKSIAHRAIIARELSGGYGLINNLELSDDIAATLRCMDAMKRGLPLDCGESASTLRFLLPIALAYGGEFRFTGSTRLLERPLAPYEKLFDIKRGGGELVVRGKLKPGKYTLDGGISSQFVTGLLFALPLLDGDSEVDMLTLLESRPYVDLTLNVLKEYGIAVDNDSYRRFFVGGGQKFTQRDFTIEGDYSQAAFWLAANALGSKIEIRGLNPESLQGDREILQIIQSRETVFDVTNFPDLVPVLAVLLCFRQGKSIISGAARLRFKECDRLSAITAELNRLGANILEHEDSLEIIGVKALCGCEVSSHNDHRIAMALAIAATRCNGEVTLNGAECVQKSYPAFFEHYNSLIK